LLQPPLAPCLFPYTTLFRSCGSWGGNSVSENVGVKHLINIKTVAERRENMLWFRTPEKVYFKKGCMPVALDELGTEMHKKKATRSEEHTSELQSRFDLVCRL